MIKGAMSGEPFSLSGQHYTLNDLVGTPRPVQAPCPPLLIGGGGKRVLSIAAREADIVGINGTLADGVAGPEAIASMTAEAVDQKVAIVRAAAGHRIDDIEFNIRAFMVRVTDDRRAAIQQVADFVQVDPALVVESPFALVGTPAEMIDDLVRRRERWGFTLRDRRRGGRRVVRSGGCRTRRSLSTAPSSTRSGTRSRSRTSSVATIGLYLSIVSRMPCVRRTTTSVEWSDDRDFEGLVAFATLAHFELHRLALFERAVSIAFDVREVHEHVGTALS